MSEFIVTAAAQRPASMNGKCFYCHQPIGENHKDDCVLINKKVRVQMTVEYEISVPADWDKEMIEFHRNEGSWCASNAVNELAELFDSDDRDTCMCSAAHFEYLSDAGEPFLSEH